MATFISVPLKKSSEVDLVKPLTKFICATYSAGEDQGEYVRAVEELNKLRKSAVGRPLDKHESSLEILLSFLDQLEMQAVAILEPFWRRCSIISLTATHISERRQGDLCRNAKHLGAKITKGKTLASGAFSYIKDTVLSALNREPTMDISPDTVGTLGQIMLAQAQEVFFLKATSDKMKDAIIARLANQAADFYGDAFKQCQYKENLPKEVLPVLAAKHCIMQANAEYHQSMLAKQQKKFGEEIGRLQLASGAFSYIKDTVLSALNREPTMDISPDTVGTLGQIMLAQAQEVFFLKATSDKMKDAIIARLANQAADFYGDAFKQCQYKENLPKEVLPVLAAKHCIMQANAEYHQSMLAKQQKKFGEEIGRLQEVLPVLAAKHCIMQANAEYHQSMLAKQQKKFGEEIGRLQHATDLVKTVASRYDEYVNVKDLSDKISRALAAAKKDNDFIYHDRVPDLKDLEAIGKAALVKSTVIKVPISQKFTDLFEKMVPLAVQQSMTVYNSRKAEIVNRLIGQMREATNLSNGVLASLNLPAALEDLSGDSIPQSILEKSRAIIQQGGLQSIDQLIKDLPELLQRNREILDELASGAFSYIKDTVLSALNREPTMDISPDTVGTLGQIMLAQAQEVFFLKATSDKMKDAIIARLANQAADFYGDAFKQCQYKENLPKEVLPVLAAKHCIMQANAEYHQSMLAKQQKKFGEEIGRLQHATDLVKTVASRYDEYVNVKDLSDKISRALAAAKKDNDFIYHDRVPDLKDLEAIGKAALVKSTVIKVPISQKFTDLFEKMVPLAVQQSMTVYNSRKAEIVNRLIGQMREATNLSNGVLASLNLPAALEDLSGDSIPQSILEKSRAIIQQGGLQSIDQLIKDLPELLQRNREILDESLRILDEEEATDNELRNKFGQRWQRTASNDLYKPLRTEGGNARNVLDKAVQADIVVKQRYGTHREMIALLCKPEAELNAAIPSANPAKTLQGSEGGNARNVLDKAVQADIVVKQHYGTHREMIALLCKPEAELNAAIPSANPAKTLQGSEVVSVLRALLANVNEVKMEREKLENDIKSAQFDMTSKFLTALAQDGAINEEAISVTELDNIYGGYTQKVQQSLKSQEEILGKIQNSHQEFSTMRQSNADANQREEMLKKLAAAHDSYVELSSNLKEGTKFYNELTEILLKFQNKCSDIVFARKTERDELLKDLQQSIAQQPSAPSFPAVPAYQSTPSSTATPATATSSVPTPAPRTVFVQSKPQPPARPPPPAIQAQAANTSTPPVSGAGPFPPATQPVSTPAAAPSSAQGPPYPTYQGYPGCYPMPVAYNPYAYGQYSMPYMYQAPGQAPYPNVQQPQQPGYPYPQQPYYPQQ
ncbi:UNVERIFIED_CONTAM: hypothetical protein FKN15_075216 [Acipenser sinensis]